MNTKVQAAAISSGLTGKLFRVRLDLVGFSSNKFLDGWAMSKTSLKRVNSALSSRKHFVAVSAVEGSISSEDENSAGDYKVYLAVETVVQAASEASAVSFALAVVCGPVQGALPNRGQFEVDGDADCLESEAACKGDIEAALQALSRAQLASAQAVLA